MDKEMGQKFHGGHAEYASVKAEWLVPLPETLAPIDAMTIGILAFLHYFSGVAHKFSTAFMGTFSIIKCLKKSCPNCSISTVACQQDALAQALRSDCVWNCAGLLLDAQTR